MRKRRLVGIRSTRWFEPRREWGFDGLPSHAAQSLKRLLESIDELSGEQWLHIGREAAEHGEEQCLARARLDAAIADDHLELLRWLVHDAIDAAAQQVILAHGVHERAACATIRAAREPIRCAAMAVALRHQLSASDYDVLCAVLCTSTAT